MSNETIPPYAAPGLTPEERTRRICDAVAYGEIDEDGIAAAIRAAVSEQEAEVHRLAALADRTEDNTEIGAEYMRVLMESDPHAYWGTSPVECYRQERDCRLEAEAQVKRLTAARDEWIEKCEEILNRPAHAEHLKCMTDLDDIIKTLHGMDNVAALTARIAALEAGLHPLASAYRDDWDDVDNDHLLAAEAYDDYGLTVGDCRRAAALLRKDEDHDEAL